MNDKKHVLLAPSDEGAVILSKMTEGEIWRTEKPISPSVTRITRATFHS